MQILADAAAFTLADFEEVSLELRASGDFIFQIGIRLHQFSRAFHYALLEFVACVTELIFRFPLFTGVSRDLGKPAQTPIAAIEPHQDAVGPETGSILAEVEAPIQRTALSQGDVQFLFALTFGP